MAVQYFKLCRCPKCQLELDDVTTTTKVCPQCGSELEQEKLWAARKLPGHLVLPGWIGAFGWPLLFVVVGTALTACGLIHVGGVIGTAGLVYFVSKFLEVDH